MSEQQTTPMNPISGAASGFQGADASRPEEIRAAAAPHLRGPLNEDREKEREWAHNTRSILDNNPNPQPPYLGNEAQEEEDEDFDDYEDGDGGFFELLWDYKFYVLGALAAFLLFAVIVAKLAGGPAEEPPAADPGAAPEAGAAQEPARGQAAAGAPKDTGVVFGEPLREGKDGAYYLRAGEIAWRGKLENTDTGEQLTLEGPTAAQFKRAVTLPGGSITTGVFGRAEPGKPIVHASFHRTVLGEEEETSGTYYAIDGNTVIVEGTYTDERDGNTITRTYSEHAPGSTDTTTYAVTFEAPPGVPIPVLVGWEAPAAVEEEAVG